MRHLLPLLPLLPLLTLALPAQPDAPAAGKQKLAVHAVPGAKASFRAEYSQRQVIPMMNRDSETKITSDYDVEVLRAGEDGSLVAKVTWQRLQGKVGSPMGGDIEFDSAKKDAGGDDPMGVIEAFLGLVGKSLEITIRADGEVADRKPIRELVESSLENVEGMARGMAQGLLSEASIRQQAEVFGSFPKEAVAVGESWKRTDKVGSRGGLKMKSDVAVKLVALDEQVIKTAVEGRLGTDEGQEEAAGEGDDEAGHQAMLREAKIENGKIAGEATVSRKDGMLVGSSSSVSMDIEIPNPMGGDEPFRIGVTQSVKLSRRPAGEEAGEKKDAKPGK